MTTAAEQRHMDMVAGIGCVICAERLGLRGVPAEIHHVAEGSGKRSDFATAGLCREHHQGATGVHGAGVKAFCRMWKLSGEHELLVLVNKWRAA